MTTILTKKKDTTGAPAPGDLTNAAGGAELAVNTYDKRLYTKDSGGNVVEVGTNPTILNIDNIQIDGNTISSTNSNGNINLTPNGTGSVVVSKLQVTGTFQLDGNVTVGDSSADTLTINSTITSNLIFTDNTYDIGASGATRPRNLYLAGNAVVGGNTTLGDASGDSVTINASTVSTPNGLNFDSNTFVIDATNNRVGIGTASPAAPLDVNGSARFGSSVYLNGTVLGLSAVMEGVNLSYGNLAAFRTVPSDGINPYLLITSSASGITFEENGSSYGALMFKTGNSERMRIDSSGNVGIGTSSPSYKLDVQTSGTQQARLWSTDYTSLGFTVNANVSTIASTALGSAGVLAFATGAGTERMRLDSSGNLGLGVTPSAWSNIFRAIQIGNADPSFIAGRADGPPLLSLGVNAYYDGTNWKYVNSDYASHYDQYNGHFWFTAPSGTAGNNITFTQSMTLDDSGRLGIGTASPNTKLHVYGSSSNTYIQAQRAAQSTGEVGIQISGGTSGVDWYMYQPASSNSLYWFGNSSTRMVLDSSGNLLVGLTSASSGGFAGTANLQTNKPVAQINSDGSGGTCASQHFAGFYAIGTNATKTVTVTFANSVYNICNISIMAYGAAGSGAGHAQWCMGGYANNTGTSLYDAYEVRRYNTGNITIGAISIVGGGGAVTFTVQNSSASFGANFTILIDDACGGTTSLSTISVT